MNLSEFRALHPGDIVACNFADGKSYFIIREAIWCTPPDLNFEFYTKMDVIYTEYLPPAWRDSVSPYHCVFDDQLYLIATMEQIRGTHDPR